jgi:hypothetical protein
MALQAEGLVRRLGLVMVIPLPNQPFFSLQRFII